MRILFIGDVMGRSGREALETHLPKLREELKADFVIVNGENAASGAGITDKICKEFYDLGADCITTGNHIWDQREIIPYIGRDKKLLRPANYPEGTPGLGYNKYQTKDGSSIVVINIMGRLFMNTLDDPFEVMKGIMAKEKLGKTADAIFIDIHAEATSEKMAFAHYFDGQISAVIGTHTHIPTADAHVLPGGTAYMSDAGMTGDYNSVIGVEKEIAIHRFISKMPGQRMRPANGTGTLCGALVITGDNGKAKSIEPIRIGPVLSEQKPAN
jgi:metallophosphoesterase (TIGR00282 family)